MDSPFEILEKYFPVFILSVVFFSAIWIFLLLAEWECMHQISNNNKFLMTNHLVSFVFNIEFTILSLSYHDPMLSWWEQGQKHKRITFDIISLTICMGYWFYDTIACLIHKLLVDSNESQTTFIVQISQINDSLKILTHLMCSIYSMYSIFYFENDCYFIVQTLLTYQIPNAAYNMLCCTQYLPQASFRFDLFNKISFLSLFTLCQIAYMTYFNFLLWFYSQAYRVTIFCISIQISSLWMHKDHIVAVWINLIKRQGKVVTVQLKEIKTY